MHKQLEATKLAYTDGKWYVADPGYMRVTAGELLSKEYAARRRSLIGEEALTPEPGDPKGSGTVYLCAADGEGNMVSYIQSNCMGFGSGIVVPGTGISLQNRGANFSPDKGMENCLEPGKKVRVVRGFPFGVTEELVCRGHEVSVLPESITFSRGQVIWRDGQGTLCGATKPRSDGTVAVW